VGEDCLAWPVEGEVMALFDARSKSPHDGLDIRAPEGASIRAAASGKVLYSGDGIKGYGNMVILRHEQGLVTVYAHASRLLVKEGETVEQGAVVAEVGRTGSAREPHLHFEVRKREDPADPLNYLPPRSDHGRQNR
jgi:murein DD-endopeptidase MepM/ murein hydrolase activator NlpD